MEKTCLISITFICICLLFQAVVPVSAISSAVIGETVHFSGKGGGYDDMYLFLTGPNLAPGGVRLDSITSPVVSGTAASFTRVPVKSDVWEYEWDTGRTGGTLDPGTYLVWVVPQPLDRYDLRGTSHSTISIQLTNPILTAEISGSSDNEVTEETAIVTVEETTPVTGMGSPGDEDAVSGTNEGPKVTPEASENAIPQPTTAGSFLYPFVCVAGVGMFLLLCVCRNLK